MMNKKLPWIIIIFLLNISISIAEPPSENTYYNPTIGFKVTKPADWFFATAEDNTKNLQKVQLEDQEFEEKLKAYGIKPLVFITKYQEPYPDFNLSFKMNVRPYGDSTLKDPVKILNLILPLMQKLYKDFQFIDGPKEVTLSKIQSGYAKFKYTAVFKGNLSFPACSEVWIVPRDKFLYIMSTGYRQDEKNGTQKELQQIIDSIEIE